MLPVIVVTAKDLTEEDVRILSGQTERIITKDQSYLTELATAVRGRLARQPAREAAPSLTEDRETAGNTWQRFCWLKTMK